MGVFATSGDIVGGLAGAPDFTGIRILQSTTKVKTTAAIWSIQGKCPHQEFISLSKSLTKENQDINWAWIEVIYIIVM